MCNFDMSCQGFGIRFYSTSDPLQIVALLTFDGIVDANGTIGRFTVAINTCDLPAIVNLLQESLQRVPQPPDN